MAILKPEALTEENRHALIEDALVDGGMKPPVPCVRDFAPLVIIALRRANNPYMTHRKGFDAIGVEFDEHGKQLTDPVEFVFKMMLKTAEVLVLFSCTHEELKEFVRSSDKLEDAAMDFMGKHLPNIEAASQATLFVTKKMEAMSRSQAATDTEDDKPKAETLDNGKKKRNLTG